MATIILNFLCTYIVKTHEFLLRYYSKLAWISLAAITFSTIQYFVSSWDPELMENFNKNIDNSPMSVIIGLMTVILTSILLLVMLNQQSLYSSSKESRELIRNRYADYIWLNLYRNLSNIGINYQKKSNNLQLRMSEIFRMHSEIKDEVAKFRNDAHKLLQSPPFDDVADLENYFLIDDNILALKK